MVVRGETRKAFALRVLNAALMSSIIILLPPFGLKFLKAVRAMTFGKKEPDL